MKLNEDKKAIQKSKQILKLINNANRPTILIGAGVERNVALKLQDKLKKLKIPIMLTWNASDRIGSDSKNYFGRPNTWGQRYSNIIIQQSDVLLAWELG